MKQFFALALSFVLLGCLPVSVFAAEESVETAAESVIPEGETFSDEDLYDGYLNSVFYPAVDIYANTAASAGAKLTGVEAQVYTALIPFVKEIAAGQRTSTVITFGQGTKSYPSDLEMTFGCTYAEFDRKAVVLALRADFPYEMYWFDYKTGFSTSYSQVKGSGEMIRLTFKFTVAATFRGADTFETDPAKTAAAGIAAANAAAIADKYASCSDYEQYKGFKEEICALVSYEWNPPASSAIDNGPWQLLNVFDGNPATNVVCGGYMKAYQYLCDLAGIPCYSVTGYTTVAHGWNIVTLDGRNYLVDVTNCDSGMWGEDGSLFLVGAAGSPDTSYVVTHKTQPGYYLSYLYDKDMLPLWGAEVLTLSADSYIPCAHSFTTEVTKAPLCKEPGIAIKTCSLCGHTQTEEIAPLGVNPVADPAIAPTCNTPGFTEGSHCGNCGLVLVPQEKINALGHSYDDENDEYCNNCGEHREEHIETVAMHRLYNPNSGEHFYTGSVEERDNLVAAGWQYEGVAWNAPTSSGEPVFRLYNPNSGDHHYTMSAEEREMLVVYGWQYEGVCWNSATGNSVPLHRLYNPNADCGSHHYTGSIEERDFLVSVGWIYEGIGWKGVSN